MPIISLQTSPDSKRRARTFFVAAPMREREQKRHATSHAIFRQLNRKLAWMARKKAGARDVTLSRYTIRRLDS